MNIVHISVLIFIFVLLVLEMLFSAYKSIHSSDRNAIRKRLKSFSYDEYGESHPDIFRKRTLSDVPLLDRILVYTPGVKRLDRLLMQAGSKSSAGFLLFLAFGFSLGGYLGLYLATRDYTFSALFGVMLGSLPLFYFVIKKKQRMNKFEKQLPEALEFISRSLRTGRSLQNSMKLAAEHFSEPLGPEFEETLDEINFGLGVPGAFKNLTDRIVCPDLRFFVVATILQRETGGNLAELTDSLANIIRERFKLKGKIRILSAEGKLSAIILIALPFAFVGLIGILNPAHLEPLFNTDAGRLMCFATIALMTVGTVVVKKMTNFRI